MHLPEPGQRQGTLPTPLHPSHATFCEHIARFYPNQRAAPARRLLRCVAPVAQHLAQRDLVQTRGQEAYPGMVGGRATGIQLQLYT